MAITHLFPHFSFPIRAMNNDKYGLPSFETLFSLVVRSSSNILDEILSPTVIFPSLLHFLMDRDHEFHGTANV